MMTTVLLASTVDLSQEYAFGSTQSLGQGLTTLERPGFEIAIAAVTIYFVIAGFKFLTSGGNKDAVASARQMITHSIIGFILLILAFVILKFIPEYFGIGIQFIQ